MIKHLCGIAIVCDSYSVVPAHHTAASVPLLVAEDEEDIGVEEDEDNLDSSSGEMEEEEEEFHDSQLPMRVLPLYSLLSPAQQRKVCDQSPKEHTIPLFVHFTCVTIFSRSLIM